MFLAGYAYQYYLSYGPFYYGCWPRRDHGAFERERAANHYMPFCVSGHCYYIAGSSTRTGPLHYGGLHQHGHDDDVLPTLVGSRLFAILLFTSGRVFCYRAGYELEWVCIGRELGHPGRCPEPRCW